MGMILLIVLYWSGFFAAFYKASYAISVINKRYGDDDDGFYLLLFTSLLSWVGYCAVSAFILKALNND